MPFIQIGRNFRKTRIRYKASALPYSWRRLLFSRYHGWQHCSRREPETIRGIPGLMDVLTSLDVCRRKGRPDETDDKETKRQKHE